MERTFIGFERHSSRPGERVRGMVMMEFQTDLLATRFEVAVQGNERGQGEAAVSQPGAPGVVAREAFAMPLLLEVLYAPAGFSRRSDGFIAMPRGFYFFRFEFRAPAKASPAGGGQRAFDTIQVAVRLIDASGVEVETNESLPSSLEERKDPSARGRRLRPV